MKNNNAVKNVNNQTSTTLDETIVARATPPGVGGVAIVRISGPQTSAIAEKILQGKLGQPRIADLRNFYSPNHDLLDQGLAIFFKAPHSYTGEDCFEFQGHGGMIVSEAIIEACVHHGARLARPGEFTQRAYLNGKIDLTQAEAVLDLIHAESELSAKGAIRSLQGGFASEVNSFRQQLLHLRMWVEAHLDFADEEIPDVATLDWQQRVAKCRAALQELLDRTQAAARLQAGGKVVLVGRPNAGKSSLLNALAGSARAIVTDIPGTTRDLISTNIILDGLPLEIIDTAGLTVSTDVVEKIGIERAQAAVEDADLVVWVIDASSAIPSAEELGISNLAVPLIKVYNKADLNSVKQADGLALSATAASKDYKLLKPLLEKIQTTLGWQSRSATPWLARARHVVALQNCMQAMQTAVDQFTQHQASELLAEDLRLAQGALDEITGRFDADDLLGKIFAEFCIGK